MNTAAGCWLHSLDLGERAISTEIVARTPCTPPWDDEDRKEGRRINQLRLFFFVLKIWNFLLCLVPFHCEFSPRNCSNRYFNIPLRWILMRQFYLILFNFNYMKISLKSRWNPARLLLYVQARFITTRGFDEAIHPSGSLITPKKPLLYLSSNYSSIRANQRKYYNVALTRRVNRRINNNYLFQDKLERHVHYIR